MRVLVKPCLLTAASEATPPEPCQLSTKDPECMAVAGHSVITVVSGDDARQPGPDLRNRGVHPPPQLKLECLELGAELLGTVPRQRTTGSLRDRHSDQEARHPPPAPAAQPLLPQQARPRAIPPPYLPGYDPCVLPGDLGAPRPNGAPRGRESETGTERVFGRRSHVARRLPARDSPTEVRMFSLLLTSLLSAVVLAEDPSNLERVEEALARGAPGEALEVLGAGEIEPDRRDYASYLEALAWLESGEAGTALEKARDTAITFPASPWALKAAALASTAQVALGQPREAAQTLRDLFDRLASSERRRPLAEAWIELADQLEAMDAKDRAALIWCLERALDLTALSPGVELVALSRIVDHALVEGTIRDNGLEAARKFLERRDDLGMRLKLGRLLADAGKRVEALESFLAVADKARDDEIGAQALHRAARLFAGNSENLETPPSLEEALFAKELLERLLAEHSEDDLVPRALFGKANVVAPFPGFEDEAIAVWLAFARTHGEHELAPIARQRAGEKLRASHRPREALRVFEDFLAAYPTLPAWRSVQESAKAIRLSLAERLTSDKEWDGAEREWQAFLDAYPQDNRSAYTAWRLGHVAQERGDLEVARQRFRTVWQRFPGTAPAAHARFNTAQLLEDEGDFEAALATYRRVDVDPWIAPANERVSVITTPSLAVEIERTFRTEETPRATIVTRHLETFEWFVHRVDVRDYFLKTLSTSGLLDLEVSIAAPDHQAERSFEPVTRHALHEEVLELPFNEAGLYIVTARSGEREAAGAVVVTDISMVTLLSRRAVTVLGIDLRSGSTLRNLEVAIAADGKLLSKSSAETPFDEVHNPDHSRTGPRLRRRQSHRESGSS